MNAIDMANFPLANRLTELRKAQGYSQEQLAEKLEVSRQAISKWERGESLPDLNNLIALAKLYQISLDDLVQGDAPAAAAIEDDDDDEREEAAAASKHGGYNLYAFPYPIIVTGLYLLMGFFLNIWHPTWLLFLTIPMYYTAIEGEGFDFNRIPFPLLVVPLYLIMGFAWDWWHPGWLIFLTIPIYYTTVFNKKKSELQSGITLIMAALLVMGTFAMLGVALHNWGRWLMMGAGALLVGTGLMMAGKPRG